MPMSTPHPEFRNTRAYARESKVSREILTNCSRPVRLLQSMLMPVQIARDCSNLSIANGTNRRLSVTSTTCAGRPSALWGELALGRKGTQMSYSGIALRGALNGSRPRIRVLPSFPPSKPILRKMSAKYFSSAGTPCQGHSPAWPYSAAAMKSTIFDSDCICLTILPTCPLGSLVSESRTR
jgi:hypothetical protein